MSTRRERRDRQAFGMPGAAPVETAGGAAPFEVADYLGVIRDRLPILILLPLTAVIVVIGLVLASPKMYHSSATVSAFSLVSSDDPQFGGQNGARQFVDTFVGVVQSGAVNQRIASRVNLKPAKIADNIKAAAIGTSGLVNVSYTAHKKTTATNVAQVAAEETLRLVFRADVSQQLAKQAQDAVDRIHAQMDKLLADNHLSLADVDEDVARQQIATLENDLVGAQSRNEGVAQYTAAVNAKRTDLASRTGAIRQFAALKVEEGQAEDALAKAQTASDEANAKVTAASSSGTVVALHTAKPVSPVDDVLRKGGLAMGVAAFLAAGIVVVTEFMQTRSGGRRNRRGTRSRSRRRRA